MNASVTRMALIAYLRQGPTIPFNSIKSNPISNKMCLNPLDLDFIWIRIKLYSLIDTSHLNMPDLFNPVPCVTP